MSRRNPTGPYMADGCAPLPGAVPWGSGPNFQTGRQTNQAANTTRLLTDYPAGAPTGLTPWSLYNGGPYESQSTRSVEGVTAEGGPVTWVVTVNGRELVLPRSTVAGAVIPTDRQTITSQGTVRTRVQAVIEWSTGTGTNEWTVVDVSQGVVFRVFGTVARVHPFFYPSPASSPTLPSTQILTDNEPVSLAGTSGFYGATVVQASVQTSKNRSEGFPGSWQCTAGLSGPVQAARVPPFARRVQVQQAVTGAVIPVYEWVDVFGDVIGTVSRTPGTRETASVSVPFGAELLRIPALTPGTASAVFEVSQF